MDAFSEVLSGVKLKGALLQCGVWRCGRYDARRKRWLSARPGAHLVV
jgi:hypothetical protein